LSEGWGWGGCLQCLDFVRPRRCNRKVPLPLPLPPRPPAPSSFLVGSGENNEGDLALPAPLLAPDPNLLLGRRPSAHNTKGVTPVRLPPLEGPVGEAEAGGRDERREGEKAEVGGGREVDVGQAGDEGRRTGLRMLFLNPVSPLHRLWVFPSGRGQELLRAPPPQLPTPFSLDFPNSPRIQRGRYRQRLGWVRIRVRVGDLEEPECCKWRAAEDGYAAGN
jgi:hypothetical protein